MTTGVDDTGRDMAQKVGNPVIYNMPPAASYAGNQTYTPSDLLGGTIVHDGTGGVTATFPTAAALVAAIPGQGGARVGDTLYCLITNGANVSGAITIGLGSGGSFDANQGGGSRTIPFGTSKTVQIRITNATKGSEAYTVYS
ncbi:hypothetical protein [Bradyrhizobium sp. USDA 4452]